MYLSERYASIPPPCFRIVDVSLPADVQKRTKSKNNQKTKKMNYRFISRKQIAMPTFEQISNAEIITNLDEQIEAAKGIAPFEFEKNEELTNVLRKFGDLFITVEKLPNGSLVNRGKFANGVEVRGWGVKDATIPEQTIKSDDVNKLTFGYCRSNGELITKPVTQNGVPKLAPVFYVELA